MGFVLFRGLSSAEDLDWQQEFAAAVRFHQFRGPQNHLPVSGFFGRETEETFNSHAPFNFLFLIISITSRPENRNPSRPNANLESEICASHENPASRPASPPSAALPNAASPASAALS